jgi:hypothetical protein
VAVRVARWFAFKPKIPICVNFGSVLQWKILEYFTKHLVYYTAIGNNSWPFGIFCCHLVYFVSFGIFLPVLVFCSKKNLPTPELVQTDLHIAGYLEVARVC